MTRHDTREIVLLLQEVAEKLGGFNSPDLILNRLTLVAQEAIMDAVLRGTIVHRRQYIVETMGGTSYQEAWHEAG